MSITIPIQPYLETRDCPACNNPAGQVSLKFIEAKQILNLDQQEFTADGVIRKTCRRCGFSWPEYPAWEGS